MRKVNRDLVQGPLFSNIILYTIPIICTSLLQLLFNAADLIVVGAFAGSISLAAVGATGSITNLIVNLFIGLSVGAGVITAHGFGRQDARTIHRAVHTALPTALVGGGVLTVAGIFLAEPLLRMMGTPENVLELAALYMKIYFGGMIFNMVYNFCAAILRAAGDAKSPLVFLTVAGVVNVVLNLLFVVVFHMNVAGVALATTISQAVSAVLVVLTLMKRDDVCRLDLRRIRFYKEQFLEMLRIGLPAGIQGSMFSISNVLIQSSINSFGDVFMSASAAAGNIEGFVYTAIGSFQVTALNFVGQNNGAGRMDRVKKTLWICVGCVVVIGLVVGTSAYAAAESLLGIYIRDSKEAIAYGVQRMAFMCLPNFLCALMEVTTGVMRGLGASLGPMIITVMGVCGFRILWIYTAFQAVHTPDCLFISYPVSWALTAIVQFIACFVVLRNRKKQQLAVQT